MKVIFKVQNACDRDKVITALANSGYNVHVEEEKDNVYNTSYYVVVEDGYKSIETQD